MSDATADDTGGVLSVVLSPIGAALALVLAPVDFVFQPFATAYNRTLGRFYGEISGLQFLLLLVGFGGILSLPVLIDSFVASPRGYLVTFAFACIWAIFAMSWDIQSGYTGYISFGHSVLSGVAGYTTGMVLMHSEVVNEYLPIGTDPGMAITIPISIAVALIVGLLVALPTLRLEGPYFSLITFVSALLFVRLIPAFSEWTGGAQQGINLVVESTQEEIIFPIAADITTPYLALVPMLVIGFVLLTIARSNVGLILMAIRENEAAVSAAGINPTKFKIWSFVVSSIPMGIGGVLLVHLMQLVSMQELVIIDNSIEMIAIAVIGGISSILGPLFAAFAFIFLERHFLDRMLEAAPVVGTEFKFLLLWLIVIAVLVFARNGLFRWLWHAAGAVRGDSE